MPLKGIFSLVLVSVLGGVLTLLRTVTGISYVRNNEIAIKVRFHSAQRERTSPYVRLKRSKRFPRIKYPYWVRKKERCQGPWRLGYPGLHGGIPFMDHWPKLSTAEETVTTENRHYILADQMEYDVVLTIRSKILGDLADRSYDPDDVYNAHFATRNLEVSIRNNAEQCTALILSRWTYSDFISKTQEACSDIKDELQAIAGLWGVQIIEVGFASRQATPRTEMLTQLPSMIKALKDPDLDRLENRAALIAALTGSLAVTAAQASHAQQAERNGNVVHHDVHASHLGVLHGLPKEGQK